MSAARNLQFFKPSLDLPPQIRHSHASSDFSYADLGGGGGLDAAQKQHQQPPNSPKPLAGRKRSFTQACTWDNLGPKALSEISASLLAGGGGWEGVQAPPTASAVGVDAPGSSCSAVPPPFMVDSALAAAAGAAAAAAPKKQEVGRSLGGHNRKAPAAAAAAAGGCSKGRRGAGAGAGGGEGAGKRPLNPERMERKASREKRRREEVRRRGRGEMLMFCFRACSTLLLFGI